MRREGRDGGKVVYNGVRGEGDKSGWGRGKILVLENWRNLVVWKVVNSYLFLKLRD